MATTSSAKAGNSTKENDRKKIVADYVLACEEKERTPSLREFVSMELERIVELTDFRRNVTHCWTTLFENGLKELNVEGAVEQDVDWTVIYSSRNNTQNTDLRPSSSISSEKHSTTTTTRTCNRKSAKIMTDEALKEVNDYYESVLEAGNVWTLKSGRIVEQRMKECAMGVKYEHPVHSMILNPDDHVYVDFFTEEELQEIREFNSIEFDQELPLDLRQYLYSFVNKKTLKDLNSAIMHKTFDPLTEGDLYWARQSFEETVNLYNFRFFDYDYVEDDVEYRIWPFVSKCFDPTELRARSGKRISHASSERHNQKRTLSAHEPTARHITGSQPDMKCMYLNHELGFSEVGLKDDGDSGTKELFESGMKAPKMLKDFFTSIVRTQPSIIRLTKTAAFIISGLHISAIIMDCPKGSACRITQSERASFPLGPEACSRQLIPILELVYRVRVYLLDTVKAIKEDNEVVSVGRKGTKRAAITPCITSPSGTSSYTSSSSTSSHSSKKQRQ